MSSVTFFADHSSFVSVEPSYDNPDEVAKADRFFKCVAWYDHRAHRATKINAQFLERDPSMSLARLAGDILWRQPPGDTTDLDTYQRAISEIVQDIFHRYCPTFEGVLELGSGTLPITRFLPNVPEPIKNQIHLSDLNPHTADFYKAHFPHLSVHHVDCRKLTEDVSQNRYNCLISNDLCSVLNKDELSQTYQTAYKVLKLGGVFIQMQTRESFPSASTDVYCRTGNILFPAQGSSVPKGFYVVEQSEFQMRLYTLSDSDPQKTVLGWYLMRKAAEREEFCDLLLLQEEGTAVLNYLTECMKKLKCLSMKKINLNRAYVERSVMGLQDAGFDVVQSCLMTSQVIGPRERVHYADKDFHLFGIDRGERSACFSGVLDRGFVQEKARIHVIVAKKNPSSGYQA